MEDTLSLLTFTALFVAFLIIISSAGTTIDDLKEENKQLRNENTYLKQFRKR